MIGNKGQFFIIAAVIMASSLFVILSIYRGYYAIDTSEVQIREEGFVLNNVEMEAREIFSSHAQDECALYKDRIESFDISIERQASERGVFVNLIPSTTRGCLWTNFTLEVRTKSGKVSKKWDMNTSFDPFYWELDTNDQWNEHYEISNVEVSGGAVHLETGETSGRVSYSKTADEGEVWWALHDFEWNEPPAGGEIRFEWHTNESGTWVTYDSFEQLPEKPFTTLNQTIILERNDIGEDVNVTFSNVTYATK